MPVSVIVCAVAFEDIHKHIHGVSGGMVNILGGGSMDFSE
jgi:hypothetical protein